MPESFGGEIVTSTSFTEIIKALPVGVVILSILLAVLPFILYRLRKNSSIKELIIRFFTMRLSIKGYFERQNLEKATKEEYTRFTESDKNQNVLKSILGLVIPGIFIVLILTKSLFFGIVTTQSMVPAIYPKELVLIEGLTKDIKKGDIIAFKKPGYQEIVIHRVFSVEDSSIRTKGDNADIDTWALRKKDILGKAVTIFGKPIAGLKNIGFYFMPIKTPFAASDPSVKAMTNTIDVIRLYGPIISAIMLLLALLTPPERRKKYYGKLG